MPDETDPVGAMVLVVDDAPPNVKLLRLILKDAGYRVLEATSGPEALATLRRDKPDIMVLDVRMPGMTGYQVCREVRGDPEFAALPVIMVTALSLPEERLAGVEAGATDFISKPFNKKELLARVRASLVMAKLGKSGIVPQLPGAVVITGADWKVLAMSPLASVILDIPAPGILQLDFTQLLAREEQDILAGGGELSAFRLPIQGARLAVTARQQTILDAAGHPLLRLIVLSEG